MNEPLENLSEEEEKDEVDTVREGKGSSDKEASRGVVEDRTR